MSRTLALALLILAATAGVGFGADRVARDGLGTGRCPVGGCFGANGETFAAGERGPVYAFSHEFGWRTLTRLDPESLRPVGRSLRLPKDAERVVFSPDVRELLLSLGNEFPSTIGALYAPPRTPTRFLLVDLRTMQLEPAAGRRLSARLALVDVIRWPKPDEIIAQTFKGNRAIGIDPHSGAIHWQRRNVVGADGALVKVLSDHAYRVAVRTISPSGDVHVSKVITLPTVDGSRPKSPRLVLTSGRSGAHAYLLTGDGVVYSVDPVTARLTRHVVPAPSDLPSQAASSQGFLRAAPLGDRIIVTGFFRDRDDGEFKAGLYLIDPATWTARTIDRSEPSWFTSGSALVTYTMAYDVRLPATSQTGGTGVTIYDSTGALRQHLLGTQALDGVRLTPKLQIAIVPLPSKARNSNPIVGMDTAAGFRAAAAAVAARTSEVLYDPIGGKVVGRRAAPAFTDLIGPHLGFGG